MSPSNWFSDEAFGQPAFSGEERSALAQHCGESDELSQGWTRVQLKKRKDAKKENTVLYCKIKMRAAHTWTLTPWVNDSAVNDLCLTYYSWQ